MVIVLRRGKLSFFVVEGRLFEKIVYCSAHYGQLYLQTNSSAVVMLTIIASHAEECSPFEMTVQVAQLSKMNL